MWTLECDGDLFGGKRIWLRPGHKLIFGRTKPAAEAASNEQSWNITHKSVSRKHLIIDVYNVPPGSADDLRGRTEIRLIDNSKLGTTLDGHRFKDANVALSKVEHTVRLGSWEQNFLIRWRPVVLTPSMLSTKQKKLADPLSVYRERVEPLGIKLSLDYIVGQTTHVIANKRNSAKNLQALINGQYVVTEAFIEAVVSATTPKVNPAGTDGPTQAPLEVDFDANWPNPIDYVPAPGKEPVPRSQELYAPNHARLDMFSGHTVIFFEQLQLENLQDVVNNGAGKALVYNVSAANADLTAFTTFVNGLRPQKPIIVRFRGGEEEDEQWKKDFQQASQLALSQRSIDQNEFLDAIIMADIAALKQPLREEIELGSSLPPPRSLPTGMRSQKSQQRAAPPEKVSSSAVGAPGGVPVQSQDDTSATGQPAPPPRWKTFRAPYKSRFAAVDDFDPSQITKYEGDSGDDAPSAMTGIAEEPEESSAPPVQPPTMASRTRKRTQETVADASDVLDTTSILDQVTSANERYKRRKVAAGGRIESIPHAVDKIPPKPVNAVVQAMENLRRVRQRHEAGKDTAEQDVKQEMAKLKARRAELEENRLRQEEDLREQIGDADPSEIRARIQFEEMRIAEGRGGDAPDGRWDDRWNGRKNFKRFRKARRAGEADDHPPLRQPRKVIVALEEARKKGSGYGEDYWLEPSGSAGSSMRRPEGSGRRAGEHVFHTQHSRDRSASHSQGPAAQGSSAESDSLRPSGLESTSTFQAGSARDGRATAAGVTKGRRVVEEEDSEPEDVEVAESAARRSLRANKLTETQRSNGTSVAGGSKRGPSAVPLHDGVTSSKRRATQRSSRRGRADDSSDDDLRFRFTKKG